MIVFSIAGVLYTKVTPAKTLFHSTMVHEVVNRGDIFAVEVATGKLTVIDGKLADKAHWFNTMIVPTEPAEKPVVKSKTDTVLVKKMKADIAAARELLDETQIKLAGM